MAILRGSLTLKLSWFLCITLFNLASEVQGNCRSEFIPLSDVEDAVRVAYSAYRYQTVGNIIADTPFKVTKVVRHWHDVAIVAESGNTVIVMFKGTDLYQDLKRFNKEYGKHLYSLGSYVEIGSRRVRVLTRFWRSTLSLFHYFKDILAQKGKKVILTGHNFGGAIASLAAIRMADQKLWDNKRHSLITFGQPRVGNYAFADLHDTLISPDRKLRFVYHHDRIPHVPYRPQYHHFSREIYMEKHSSLFSSTKMYFRICSSGDPAYGCSSYNTLPNWSISDNLKYKREVSYDSDKRRFQNSAGKKYYNWRRAWYSSC